MKYLLLVNYGLEGWAITEFDTKEELIKAVMDGDTYGNAFKIAEEMELSIDVVKKENTK